MNDNDDLLAKEGRKWNDCCDRNERRKPKKKMQFLCEIN